MKFFDHEMEHVTDVPKGSEPFYRLKFHEFNIFVAPDDLEGSGYWEANIFVDDSQELTIGVIDGQATAEEARDALQAAVRSYQRRVNALVGDQ